MVKKVDDKEDHWTLQPPMNTPVPCCYTDCTDVDWDFHWKISKNDMDTAASGKIKSPSYHIPKTSNSNLVFTLEKDANTSYMLFGVEASVNNTITVNCTISLYHKKVQNLNDVSVEYLTPIVNDYKLRFKKTYQTSIAIPYLSSTSDNPDADLIIVLNNGFMIFSYMISPQLINVN